jgi:hypothetical protein
MYNHFYILIIKFIGLKLLYLFFIRKIHMQILKNFQNFQNNLNKYLSKVSSVKTLVEWKLFREKATYKRASLAYKIMNKLYMFIRRKHSYLCTQWYNNM